MMDVQGKSDLPIVPLKPSNDAAVAAAETGEGRGGAEGTGPRRHAPDTGLGKRVTRSGSHT